MDRWRKRDGSMVVEMVQWRNMDGSMEMGWGRKREVPKLASPVTGIAGTIVRPWVNGWF